MRKALIVGIDEYTHIGSLHGCVKDACAVENVLGRNVDGTPNFANPRLLVATDTTSTLSKRDLKEAVRQLFMGDADIALFYFAGHGFIDETGGFLCASDCADGDDGLALAELVTLANTSAARSKVIILDSCHGGVAANNALTKGLAEVTDGTTILTASTEHQYAMETADGGGVFTDLLVDALSGAAANLVGDITPGSVYAHIDQSLGPWAQRPVFKTNVKRFVSLRTATPPVAREDLHELIQLFPDPEAPYQLDPSYEPDPSLTGVLRFGRSVGARGLVFPLHRFWGGGTR
ncbi:caspase family protein [Candidatus Poriferisodalis sp.]|uniref:caspase family protein n=1 Tax=Candidatus Poriferisodalis sp. TaxID=3101277 RepID=UPI003B5CBF3D